VVFEVFSVAKIPYCDIQFILLIRAQLRMICDWLQYSGCRHRCSGTGWTSSPQQSPWTSLQIQSRWVASWIASRWSRASEPGSLGEWGVLGDASREIRRWRV